MWCIRVSFVCLKTEVLREEQLQVPLGLGGADVPAGTGDDGFLHLVAGHAAVAVGAGVTLLLLALVVGQQGDFTGGGQAIPLGGHNALGDFHQLPGGVVGELDDIGEAGAQAGVGGEELLHLPGVARQDDHQVCT